MNEFLQSKYFPYVVFAILVVGILIYVQIREKLSTFSTKSTFNRDFYSHKGFGNLTISFSKSLCYTWSTA